MPTYQKRGDHWRAQVRIAGHAPRSESFPSKTAARDWALEEERKLRAKKRTASHLRTFGDLLERYAREISPTKATGPHEQGRIAFYQRDPIAAVLLTELDAPTVAAWRDRRLRDVSGSTIVRDMVILSHACNIARKEWHWLAVNPFSDVRRPKENAARERIVQPGELDALRHAAGTDYRHAAARVIAAFEFAIETGMRGGEICGLHREQLRGRVAHLTQTKNGDKRDIPLSVRALEIIAALPKQPDGRVFGLDPASKDALYRKIRERAGIVGLNFHDSRHTAITRLSRKLDVLALARVVGHRDIRQLQTYYNMPAEELAKLL